ncbi:hypothetical protein B0O99DRAFT_690458 [Bisporella sp. PMI_857]|nr:hypothetical protein B0O99DRAFT_690458 [Bisporella sp. PMI_857]
MSEGVLMDITSYDTATLAMVLPVTAGVNGILVLATAVDGISATAVDTLPKSSSSSSVIFPSTSIATSASSSPSTILSKSSPITTSAAGSPTPTTISQLPICGQT